MDAAIFVEFDATSATAAVAIEAEAHVRKGGIIYQLECNAHIRAIHWSRQLSLSQLVGATEPSADPRLFRMRSASSNWLVL